MSATLADPYRDYTIDYPHHANSRAEGQENLLVYQPHQTQIHHSKPAEVPFPSGSSHQSTLEQPHHANTAGVPGAAPQPTVHDISQTVLLPPDQMLSRQLPPQFTPTNLELPPVPRGRKRPHAETEGNDGDTERGIRPPLPVLPGEAPGDATHSAELLFPVQGGSSSPHHRSSSHQGFGPPDSVGLPQQHHHHRLPQAGLQSPESHGAGVASPSLPSAPPSVVGHPGMPEPAPRPRGPKLKFSPDEDALLVELKEHKNLTWKQIADFFPGRTSGTLQVRYCTKLKAKDVVWTDETVHRLQRAMQEYDNDRWRIIAGKVGNGFTPAACSQKASQL
ncbi:hypothetical protein PHISP_04428 [Aspergillus sp. HF37]|nr:hypothetical protein PHISP_04428 [Aspergillus sp. HF37]